MNRFNTKKLQDYILLYSSLTMLLLGLVISSASLIPLYKVLKNERQKDLLFTLNNKSLAIKEYLSRAKDIARQISSRTAARRKLETYNRKEINLQALVQFSESILEDALRQSEEIAGISRLDNKDRLVIQVGNPVPQKYWPVSTSKNDVEIWPVPITVIDEYYLVVSAPILTSNNTKVGTDIILFKLKNLQYLVEANTGLEKSGKTIVLRLAPDKGQLISPLKKEDHKQVERIFEAFSNSSELENILNKNQGILTVNEFPNNPAVFAYGPVPKSDWTILIQMNQTELYEPVKYQIILITGIILILILLSISGMLIVLRPLTGKIIIQADELEQVVLEKTAILNLELNQRKVIEKELNVARQELEKRVRTRTAELAQNNILLEQEIEKKEIAENELEKRNKELESSNKELEQFAYIASHDLQEPLRAVVSYAQLLQEEYQEQLGVEGEEYIDFIVDGGVRMQKLIKDLLAFSRIGTRGQSFVPTQCEKVLDYVLKNLQIYIQENNASIIWEPLPMVMADPSQLTQLFQNLISNAIKFRSEKPPQIHISARQIEDKFQFCIRDNGIGIKACYAERIFQIFQRLHSRRQYEGTGIGLAICRRIIERHNGKIWVESVPSQGSAFYFTLPFHDRSI